MEKELMIRQLENDVREQGNEIEELKRQIKVMQGIMQNLQIKVSKCK